MENPDSQKEARRHYKIGRGIAGAVLGAIAMGIVGMIGTLFMGHRLWWPLLMRGYAFVPFQSNVEFNGLLLLKGMIVHFITAIILGIIFVLVARALLERRKLIFMWGMAYATMVWLVAEMGLLPRLDPTMSADLNPIIFLLAHWAYGAVLGWWVSKQ
jgi:hypothetical protein